MFAFAGHHLEAHGRDCRDHSHVEFALQTFLHNLHVQHSQKTTAETKAQSRRRFGFPNEGRVVELEFFHGIAEFLELVGFHGVNTRKHHRFYLRKALNSHFGGVSYGGYGITHFHLFSHFDTRNQVAYVATLDHVFGFLCQAKGANFVGIILFAGVHKLHPVALTDSAILDPENNFDTPVGVEVRVENEGLQGTIGFAFWGWNTFYNSRQNFGNTDAFFARSRDNIGAFATQQVHHLVFDLFGHGTRQVNFIENGNDNEVVIEGQIQI